MPRRVVNEQTTPVSSWHQPASTSGCRHTWPSSMAYGWHQQVRVNCQGSGEGGGRGTSMLAVVYHHPGRRFVCGSGTGQNNVRCSVGVTGITRMANNKVGRSITARRRRAAMPTNASAFSGVTAAVPDHQNNNAHEHHGLVNWWGRQRRNGRM